MPSVLENPATWVLTQTKVTLWLLVLTRMSGLMALLPGLGQERIPMQLRAALAILMSVVIAPVIPSPVLFPSGSWDMVGIMAVELAVGLLMGLMLMWALEAVQFGAQLMDFQIGFSFAQSIDPSTAHSNSLTGTLMTQMTLLIIFIAGLHHQMILALVDSYRILPIGSGLPIHPLPLVLTTGQIFAKGLQLASPVLITLLVVDVLEGIAGKFMPQLQLIQLSFPLKISVGLAVLILVLRDFLVWLQALMEAAPRDALRLLR